MAFMSKRAKLEAGPISLILGLSLVAGVWKAGDMGLQWASQRPVRSAPQPSVAPALAGAKDYYALWVQGAAPRGAQRPPAADEGAGSAFAAFSRPAVPVPVTEAASAALPDRRADAAAATKALVERVMSDLPKQLTGTSNAGIFVGGQFVALGEPIQALGYVTPAGGVVSPRLVSASADALSIEIEGRVLTLKAVSR